MNIHITLDYELFFGASSGTVEKCLTLPTQRLLHLSKKHNIPLVFFIDAGYLYQIKKFIDHPACREDYERVTEQIKIVSESGHEIGLHFHPHWVDCAHDGKEWKMNTQRYRADCFSKTEINTLVNSFHQEIITITGKPCCSFRAGGWCIQPFEIFKEALSQNNIFIDSSVYPNGKHLSKAHYYDFTNAPEQPEWKFENDPLVVNSSGQFIEYPITSDALPPLFYFHLYWKMKTRPLFYKPIGDGMWLKDKKKLYKQFYSSTSLFASADGFFASRLKNILQKQSENNKQRMVILSHPKSLAECSYYYLEHFIEHALKQKHTFKTFTQ